MTYHIWLMVILLHIFVLLLFFSPGHRGAESETEFAPITIPAP
jgi:hypothetical protein